MVLAVALLIGLNLRAMFDTLGSGVVAAALLFVLSALAIGYALGGPSPATRSVLGLGTGQRNIAAALIVTTENAVDPAVVTTVLVCTLVGLLVLVPAARVLARHAAVEVDRRTPPAGALLPEEVAR
jgi:BASS family bile acid:Na+ symporter